MSRSKHWKSEWEMFIGSDGRRKYNPLCKKCARDCKQSFKAIIVDCPSYISKRRQGWFYCSNMC